MSVRIPILVYHSVAENPAAWIAPFAVPPDVFTSHLDAVVEAGATTMTVSELVDALHGPARLPQRLVLMTFDDGFGDFATAFAAMAERGIRCTLYAATAYTETATGPAGEPMLSWSELTALQARGVEVGAHSHTHPQLDVLTRSCVSHEIDHSKELLEAHLRTRVRSFAYPHGYSSPSVRRLVRAAGFDSACGVGNAFSHPQDDVFRLARIMVRADTTASAVANWIAGRGAPLAPLHERGRTRAWRLYRRAAVRAGVRKEREL
ncbi:MAG: polysaccharide deacetylase family protein [Solirubrobacteraceae bacterium]